MYKHLTSFYFTDWRQTHIQMPKEKRTSLFAAGEPSPALSLSALAGPPQAACGASRPRLPPTGRAGGTSEEEGSASQFCGSTVTRREHTGEAKRREIQEEEEEPRGRGRAPRVSVLYGAGLRPSLRPFLAPPPFWQLSKKGRSPLPAASHRASTNRRRVAPPRLRHTPRRKQAGKIRAPLGTPVVSFREARSVIVVVGGRWV